VQASWSSRAAAKQRRSPPLALALLARGFPPYGEPWLDPRAFSAKTAQGFARRGSINEVFSRSYHPTVTRAASRTNGDCQIPMHRRCSRTSCLLTRVLDRNLLHSLSLPTSKTHSSSTLFHDIYELITDTSNSSTARRRERPSFRGIDGIISNVRVLPAPKSTAPLSNARSGQMATSSERPVVLAVRPCKDRTSFRGPHRWRGVRGL
jgi:hypothetical protein